MTKKGFIKLFIEKKFEIYKPLFNFNNISKCNKLKTVIVMIKEKSMMIREKFIFKTF